MFKKLFNRIGRFFVEAYERTKKFVTGFFKSCSDRIADAKRTVSYTVEVLKSERGFGILLSIIKDKVVEFFSVSFEVIKRIAADIRDNWEAATVLVFATIGVTHILGQIPLTISVPMCFEAPMILPVIAIFVITVLTMLMLKKGGEPCLEK
jgi:hypothetical protein